MTPEEAGFASGGTGWEWQEPEGDINWSHIRGQFWAGVQDGLTSAGNNYWGGIVGGIRGAIKGYTSTWGRKTSVTVEEIE